MTTTSSGSAVGGVRVEWDQRRALFSLDPRVAYLNHGAFGAVPVPVRRAQQRLLDEVEANPMAFFSRGLVDRLVHTRRHLAAFVGADPERTAMLTNATAAANAVLASVRLSAGEEILVTDHCYGAVLAAAEQAARRAGATIRTVAVPLLADDDEIVSRLVDAVRPGRTRLAIVDQVTSPTARLFPVGRLVTQLRRLDVLVLVDGAHAPGMLALDVTALDADYWLGNLHKWALTPRPTALLTVAEQHRRTMRPLVVSWEHEQGFPLAQEFAGTLDYTAWLAAPAGLHLLCTLDPDRVRSHNSALAALGQRLVANAVPGHATDTLLELAREGRLGDDGVSMRLVPCPPGVAADRAAADTLRTHLASVHRIEVALGPWQGRGFLRLSAQLYNTLDDYERLARALRDML